MPIITDNEFGEILLKRSAKARQIRIRLTHNGRLQASLPLYAPIFLVKRLIASSRPKLRSILEEHNGTYQFQHGMQIGKSHTLFVQETSKQAVIVSRQRQQIIVELPGHIQLNTREVQQAIRHEVIKAYRREAKSYLDRRLSFLSNQHGFLYQKVRFSHAGSRWGSCSSSGTISLNIALMKLPFPLIDYVLIHELAHTKEMNHSKAFWAIVEKADPNYKVHRETLKRESPAI